MRSWHRLLRRENPEEQNTNKLGLSEEQQPQGKQVVITNENLGEDLTECESVQKAQPRTFKGGSAMKPNLQPHPSPPAAAPVFGEAAPAVSGGRD